MPYKLEEDEGQDECEQEDYHGAYELDSKESALSCCEQALLLVHKTEGNHTPQAAEQVRLGCLQWVVKLVSIQE